ncbi:hypothetical protein Taro_030760 [Colocasia esculenta]|uniref:Mini-chromosome maintenance complex-binding protein n=1 Tax=Colocasia esculenta TaxID=4460 RepID=A0A843W4A8_COLES|nr:hypothetical protein [Colocasia esculenta]
MDGHVISLGLAGKPVLSSRANASRLALNGAPRFPLLPNHGGEEEEEGGREVSREIEGKTMVGLPYDCLANPLGAVRLSFEKAAAAAAVSSGFDPATFDRKDWGAVDLFRSFLFEEDGLSQVPVLDSSNLHLIRPNSLVRFRGLVEDMLGNELYIGAFKVPGQNSWTLQSVSSPPATVSNDCLLQHGEKRRRDEDNNGMDLSLQDFGHGESGSPTSNKKQKEGEFSYNSSQGLAVQHLGLLSSTVPLDANPLSCLIKMYDPPENDIKVNDVIEFIGVYTFDPELAVHSDDNDDLPYDLMEDAVANLPPSKVPRLHCIISKKLSLQDFVSRSCFTQGLPNMVKGVRESLLGHLTAVLGNDGLAAQFVLLHLLSRVRARVDVVVVGKLSVNLTGFTRESSSIFGKELTRSITGLLPFSQAMHLSVEYLNTTKLQPRKDNNTGRMMTGILQLAQGTHLTVDETSLNAGTLNSTGVENARLLRQLMEWQTVGYDFEYYKLEMPADVQVLILSEKKSNILPADLVLPFHPAVVNTDIHATDELQAWRWYLATMRYLPHSIEPQMQKVLEDDFVAARQEDKSLKAEDFSRWLTMGQLVSASFGETDLSLEHWQMVKEFERLRKERFR